MKIYKKDKMTGLLLRRAIDMSRRSFKMGPVYLDLRRGVRNWFWVQLSSLNPLKLVLALPILGVVALLIAIILLAVLFLLLTLWLAWMMLRPLRRSSPDEFPGDEWEWRE